MDLNFFKKIRILDAGMGQELLARGLVSKGTLWSATSLLDEKYYQLVIDTHLSSINEVADQSVPLEIRPLARSSCPIPESKILIFLKKPIFI